MLGPFQLCVTVHLFTISMFEDKSSINKSSKMSFQDKPNPTHWTCYQLDLQKDLRDVWSA